MLESKKEKKEEEAREYLEYARDNNLIDSSVVLGPCRVSYD